jgi:phosphopantothenoylcysteine decarboxylase/phosphopantothenate--cysteine ligase
LRQAAGNAKPLLIGFAAETGNLLDNARDKVIKKAVDAIVLNDVSRAGIGFNSDRNEVTIVTANDAVEIPEASKLDVAVKILEAALRLRQERSAAARLEGAQR